MAAPDDSPGGTARLRDDEGLLVADSETEVTEETVSAIVDDMREQRWQRMAEGFEA